MVRRDDARQAALPRSLRMTIFDWRGCRGRFELRAALFQQPLLDFFLTGDAIARPGDSFEALSVEFVAAVHALTVAAFANAV